MRIAKHPIIEDYNKGRPVTFTLDGKEMNGFEGESIAAALKAPTATNQQKFMFSRSVDTVHVQPTGGFYSNVDLGIVKCHFEICAGKDRFSWR